MPRVRDAAGHHVDDAGPADVPAAPRRRARSVDTAPVPEALPDTVHGRAVAAPVPEDVDERPAAPSRRPFRATYDGGDNARTFLLILERTARLLRWTNEETVLELLQSLTGQAAAWVATLQETILDDWPRLRARFVAHFGVIEHAPTVPIERPAALALRRLRQQPGASVVEYSAEFIRACTAAELNRNSKVALSWWLDGLHSRYHAAVLACPATDNLDALIKYAAELEALQSTTAAASATPYADTRGRRGPNPAGLPDGSRQYVSGFSTAGVQQQLQTVPRQPTTAPVYGFPRTNTGRPQEQATGSSTPTASDKGCSYCRRYGHTIEECRNRMRALAASSTNATESGASTAGAPYRPSQSPSPFRSVPPPTGSSAAPRERATADRRNVNAVTDLDFDYRRDADEDKYTESEFEDEDDYEAHVYADGGQEYRESSTRAPPSRAHVLANSFHHATHPSAPPRQVPPRYSDRPSVVAITESRRESFHFFHLPCNVRAAVDGAALPGDGYQLEACVDTGAALSLIDVRWIQEHPEFHLDADAEVPSLRAANGGRIQVFGVTTAQIAVPHAQSSTDAAGRPNAATSRQARLIAVKLDAHFQLILGMDFLRDADLLLHPRTGGCVPAAATCMPASTEPRATAPTSTADNPEAVLALAVRTGPAPDATTCSVGERPASAGSHRLVIMAVADIVEPSSRLHAAVFDDPDRDEHFWPVESMSDAAKRTHLIELRTSDSNAALTDLAAAIDGWEAMPDAVQQCLVTRVNVFSSTLNANTDANLVLAHDIPTKAGPVAAPIYPHPPAVEVKIEEEVNQMLAAGIIRRSQSPWRAPVVLVRKKDGTLRFCVDFRALNKVTARDSFPMPSVEATLSRLGGARLFSTLDLLSGFWQVPVHEADRPKTAFATRSGLYEFNVMPFGLVGAPATFQRLMNHVLGPLLGKICFVYLDDIIVFSDADPEQHAMRLAQVLDALNEANLRVKPSKCSIARTSLKFLGHVVDGQGVHTDMDKVVALRSMKTPTKADEVRVFLGVAGYYRRFVRGFAEIAEPLVALLRKATPFRWTAERQQAFDKLLAALTAAPVLAQPDWGRPFILATDASSIGLGAILSQQFEDAEHPIAFASKLLNSAQRNYSATERECLAVVWGLQHFKQYVLGSPVQVQTDHQALRWLLDVKEPTSRLARWVWALNEFELTIVHRPGRAMAHADALSRLPALSTSNDHEALPVAQVRKASTATTAIAPIADTDADHAPTSEDQGGPQPPRLDETTATRTTSRPTIPDQASWAAAQRSDPLLGGIIDYIRDESHGRSRAQAEPISSDNSTALRMRQIVALVDAPSGPRLFVDDAGLLRAHGKVNDDASTEGRTRDKLVVPSNLVPWVLRSHHDDASAGHFGFDKTAALISADYFWPHMINDIRAYVSSCTACAARKHPTARPFGSLQPIVVHEPFELVSIDVMGPMSETDRGNKFVVVISEHLTKWTEAFAVARADARTVATLLVDEFFFRYGAPRKLLSDRGSIFTGSLIKEICNLFRVRKIFTTAYNPQTDGQTERFNKTLAAGLAILCRDAPKQWDVPLPAFMFAYRAAVHKSTGETPFFAVFGRDPLNPADLAVARAREASPWPLSISQWLLTLKSRLLASYARSAKNVAKSREAQTRSYNASHRPNDIQVGNLVMLRDPSTPIGLSDKLHCHWKGPYRVEQVVNNEQNCIIVNVASGNRERVHVHRLRRLALRPGSLVDGALEDLLTSQPGQHEELGLEAPHARGASGSTLASPARGTTSESSPPTATDSEPDDIFTVEQILASRGRGKRREFLVKWLGYPDTDNSWVKQADILDRSLIYDFEHRDATNQQLRRNTHSRHH